MEDLEMWGQIWSEATGSRRALNALNKIQAKVRRA